MFSAFLSWMQIVIWLTNSMLLAKWKFQFKHWCQWNCFSFMCVCDWISIIKFTVVDVLLVQLLLFIVLKNHTDFMCSAHFIAIPSHFKDINLLIDSFHQRFSEHFLINFRFRMLFVYKTRQFFLSTQSSKLPYKRPKTCMSFEKKTIDVNDYKLRVPASCL